MDTCDIQTFIPYFFIIFIFKVSDFYIANVQIYFSIWIFLDKYIYFYKYLLDFDFT